MPLKNILRVFISEGIENFYICRKEDVDVLIEGVDRLHKENEELKNIDLTTVYLKGVADEKERWRNKIREEIEKEKTVVETCYGRIKYQEGKIEGLQNLLEEE